MSQPRFCRLSAGGAAALSIWELRAEPSKLIELFNLSVLPEADVPAVVNLHTGPQQELVDQGLLWIRKHPADAEHGRSCLAELHLHGGFGVAAALAQMLRQKNWQEFAEFYKLGSTSPLATRLRLAHEANDVLAATENEAQRMALAHQVEPFLPWVDLVQKTPRIVLAGPPNAGKSTVFNAWLQDERVTVSPFPGTTRDAVSAGIKIGSAEHAFDATLVDTAGIWSSAESLDSQAVHLAQKEIQAAWRVIWLLDGATSPSKFLAETLRGASATDIFLVHRQDLPAAWDPEGSDLLPEGAQWRYGSVLIDGPALLKTLGNALLGSMGTPPPVGMWLPLAKSEQEALRLASQQQARR